MLLLLDTGCAELLTGPDAGWEADLDPCGLPLEVLDRRVLPSTDGPVEHLSVQCPRGHRTTHVSPPPRPGTAHASDEDVDEAA